MIKVLVTGASGTIGVQVLKYLLSEGKYEITALDLGNSKVHQTLKKYKKRINIIYGDICDRILMESLVKENDYIIHLASVLPPLSNLKRELTKMVEYEALENIVRSINYYNPNATLIYASSTSIYRDSSTEVDVKTKIVVNSKEPYNFYKNKAEILIKEKLKKYVIVRVPLVISTNPAHAIIYNVNKKSKLSIITNIDAGYAFVKTIDHSKELNKKTINIASNDDFIMSHKNLMKKIINNRGLNYKYILSNLFLDKNYYSVVCSDVNKFNDILNYQIDTIDKFNDRLYYEGKRKIISKFFGKIYTSFWRTK